MTEGALALERLWERTARRLERPPKIPGEEEVNCVLSYCIWSQFVTAP